MWGGGGAALLARAGSLAPNARRKVAAVLWHGGWTGGSWKQSRAKGDLSVILTSHVEGLGRPGQVVRVSRGHARNQLLPKRQALPAIEKYTRLVEHLRKKGGSDDPVAAAAVTEKVVVREEDRMQEAAAAAQRLDKHRLSIRRHTLPKSDAVRFPVTPRDIVKEVLRQTGIVLSEAHLGMPHPLAALGEHEVALNFPKGVKLPGEKEVLTLRVYIRRQ